MQYKISNEQPFQVLCSSFSISPSQQNYTLNISADGRNYSPLFTVASGQTRLVTGVASGSYYKLVGNQSEVVVNWVRSCNDGGSGGGGSTYTAGEYISIDQDIISVTGITPDLYLTSADTQDFATEADITAATSPIQEQLDDVERVTASALTELHNDVLELSGATPTNSPIIPAITSQAEYEAISGDVKTGDLIQVQGVDLDGDNEPEYGLFEANVQEEEDQGVIRKLISWTRMDNGDSVYWSYEDYPWMTDIDVNPIELNPNGFIISPDTTADDEAYNGIGFNVDGKPVTTHIVPQYDEQTGDITGMTREDRDILGELDDVAADVNEAFSAITETQQVASAGLNSLQGQINTLSGNTYTKAEVDAEITGATSDMKTYVDNRIDGYDSAVTLTTASTNSYLRMDGSTVCTAGDIAWQALGRPRFFTTNIQQYEIGNAPHEPGLGTVNYLKFNYVGETDSVGAFTGVYYALPANGEFVDGVPVQLTRTTSVPSTVYNTPAGADSGYFIWDNVNLTITWKSQPVIVQHVPGVVKSDGVITKVQKLTQAEYDAIVTPDASTLYIIVNN